VTIRRLRAPTRAEIAGLADIFDVYREHYGELPDHTRTAAWLDANIEDRRIEAFVAQVDGEFVGFATVATVPASPRLGCFWQIRDLCVAPGHRRRGIARALLDAIRDAATAASAVRVSLLTEADNEAALRLYAASGYEIVDGYRSLTLQL
jgi:ribosomal protein S18 acetylase RimI-like enzyme